MVSTGTRRLKGGREKGGGRKGEGNKRGEGGGRKAEGRRVLRRMPEDALGTDRGKETKRRMAEGEGRSGQLFAFPLPPSALRLIP